MKRMAKPVAKLEKPTEAPGKPPMKMFAIRFRVTPSNKSMEPYWEDPAIIRTFYYNDNGPTIGQFYWGFSGPTRFSITENSKFEVLESYGTRSEFIEANIEEITQRVKHLTGKETKIQREDILEAAEDVMTMKFLRAYCIPKERTPQGLDTGWLSPEGRFFPCGYGDYVSASVTLLAYFYDTIDGRTDEELEGRGWFALTEDGHIHYGPHGRRRFTAAQAHAVNGMIQKAMENGEDKDAIYGFQLALESHKPGDW